MATAAGEGEPPPESLFRLTAFAAFALSVLANLLARVPLLVPLALSPPFDLLAAPVPRRRHLERVERDMRRDGVLADSFGKSASRGVGTERHARRLRAGRLYITARSQGSSCSARDASRSPNGIHDSRVTDAVDEPPRTPDARGAAGAGGDLGYEEPYLAPWTLPGGSVSPSCGQT